MLGAGKNTIEIILAARDRTRAAFTKVNAQMRTLGGSTTKLNTGMGALRSSFTNLRGSAGKLATAIGPLGLAAVAAAAAIAIASIGVAAVRSFAEFEDAMASVRKTTGFTKSEIKVLGDAINDLALRIPVAQTELAGIAAVAGQLGIQGKEDILSFTETVAMMTTAFDMPAESVAIAMAKLGKIYDIPIEQTSNLGSAINYLGNTTAASESQLLAFSMALGPTGQQLGFIETEILSLGASMISMGMDASNAGTRLNRAFTMIGQNLEELAEFMKIPAEEFVESFEGAPMETFLSVIDKLSQVEGKLKANTVAAEIFGEIGAKGIKSIAEDVDGVRENLLGSNKAFKDNTSLAEEFAAKTDTLNAKFAIFGNTVESFKIQIGGALAPLAGALVEGARIAIEGLSLAFGALQTVVSTVIGVFKPFFDTIHSAISSTLAPLVERITELRNKFKEGAERLTILNDIITITSAAAKWLGEKIGILVKMALTPFVDKLKEGIDMLTDFYNKLGPIKDLIEGAKGWFGNAAEAVHNFAESVREAKEPIEEVAEELEKLVEEGPKAPKAIADAWALATKAFQEGAGEYKDAISEINKEVEALKKEWITATDERKAQIDRIIILMHGEAEAADALQKSYDDHFTSLIGGTDEAIEKTKEFIVTIGDTTIEFKGAAAEVVKNADAYEKLQDSAQTLLDLNWSVFSEFEASLPNIQSGIGNMESAFVGLKDILEDNIGALENVKQSVTGISEIAAPFLEKGFAESVKAISKFAGALKDAGSAISDFSGLQDVSIEGCIKFSLHIHDMVSALGILKDQMRDLEPLFSSLNSLIGDLSESFVYSGDKVAGFTSSFSEFIEGQVGGLNDLGIGYAETTAPMEEFFGFIEEKGFAQLPEAIGLAEMTKSLKYATQDFSDMGEIYQKMISRGSFSWLEWSSEENDVRLFTEEVHNAADAVKVWEYATTMRSVRGDESALITSEGTFQIKEHTRALGTNIRANQNWIKSNYGVRVSTEDMYAVMQKPPEEQQKWFEEMLRTGPAIAHQWDKQTAAISANGKKLKQLTDAMQPHLAFMRTMNELAALSTLSTAELNAGLDAITDTLTNLGTVLNTFDLRSTMESLFGTKIPEGDLEGQFTGGFATPFVDVLQEFAGPFNELIIYSTRLTSAITGLVSAFDTLNDISDSVLLDTTALTEVFEDMVKILNNLEEAFGKNGFGETLADALGDMIKSAAPLTDYFQKNNAAVIRFNNTLGMFKTTITNVVDTMELLKKMSEMVLPSVDELEAGFDKAKEAVLRFDKALLGHMGMGTEGTVNMEKNLNTVFRAIIQFAEDWSVLDKSMGDSFEVFEDGIDTITKLISSIVSLVSAFESMKDIAIPSATEMGTVFDEIGKGITEFTKVVRTKFPAITPLLVTFDEEWQKHKLTIDNTLPSLKEAINTYTTLISLAISLTSAYDSLAVKEGELAKIRVISAKDLADALKDIPKIITELSGLIDLPIWTDIIAKLGEFKPKWDEISKGVKESVDSFSEVISIFTSIISSAKSLSDTFTDLEEIVVITADQIETAFKDIPSVIDEVISYLTRKSFTDIKEALKSVHAEWAKHKAVIDETMPSFNAAIDTITTLVSKVLSLSSAFVELKDMSVLSVRDIDEAMKKIPEFLDRFVDALRLNMTGIKEALSDLDKEWAKHAEEMEGSMPSFTTATSEIGTLISSVLSLNSALDDLSSMGVIHGREFDKGFSSLITSISNFAVSLAKNVDELMISLNQLRVVWIENEAVLLPLMKDFAIITDNLWGVAHNANRMAKEFDAITKNSKTLEKGFASLITFINQVVEGTKKFYTPEAAAEIAGFIEDVGKVIDAFVDLEIELQNAMSMVKTKISNAVGDIKEKLSSLTTLVASAETWGANIMSSYISGIRSKSEELRLAVADQAAIVEDYLGAESPTRLGPLSKLNEWPENLMSSYSAGIENEMPSLNQTFGLLAPNMGAASPAGGNRKVDIYVTQHIGSRADADYSAEALRRVITRHEVM